MFIMVTNFEDLRVICTPESSLQLKYQLWLAFSQHLLDYSLQAQLS